MSVRGPKIKTAENSSRSRKGIIRRTSEAPASTLVDVAQIEYQRLLEVLRVKGTLDRVDLAVVTEASRIKALLDRAHKASEGEGEPVWGTIKLIGLLTTQRRGLLRELGLTLQPSQSKVRTNAVPAESEADPIASRIKLSG